ncbi:hypothetical protein S40285_02569 [Stachybotrys chlorohalonatus IBT 40285]|uniref:Uncharacterized protein n=1 Tax=Stachybotrys chlorohalonatus (strain IBT 40285) TaxID=1283841 RepID=A0A084QVT0_STAC4|nr:hypothetical protein S40285_02569 [Stachybotrys chlorohalonata IBT 40285]
MPKPAALPVSGSTPAATRDGFSFINGELFAHASGSNQHRRATAVELQSHFSTGSDKDHPAHWFEAQLIHYGLRASKTKAVARMRLYDAVKGGNLSVPANITKLEGELKKEWTKKDRDAKKASKEAVAKNTTGVKRKADVTASSTKKLKTTSTPTTTTTVTTTTAASKGKNPASTASKNKAATTKPEKKASARPKDKKGAPKSAKTESVKNQTPKKSTEPARQDAALTATEAGPSRGIGKARRGGIAQGPSRASSTTVAAEFPRPRTKQTARRSGAWAARGRIASSSSSAPREKSIGSAIEADYMDYYDTDTDSDNVKDEDGYDDEKPRDLAPLGLLNGTYRIISDNILSQWPHVGNNFELTLTLEGNRLWAKFDLGIVEGVMLFDERPRQSSHEPVRCVWRGRQEDGLIMYGNDNSGSIRFLGNGYVQGKIDYMDLRFEGQRDSRQGTTSSVIAHEMRSEWDEYSEDRYEYARRARWR